MLASPGDSSGSSMCCLRVLAVAYVAILAIACTDQRGREAFSVPVDRDSLIVKDDAIYTPASVGPLGCILYNVEIPGGHAPTALVYRSDDGSFSYARPERCVMADE